MNGMLLELRTLARDQRRQSARENSVDPAHATSDPELSHDPQAERAFDRAWARGVLADAASVRNRKPPSTTPHALRQKNMRIAAVNTG